MPRMFPVAGTKQRSRGRECLTFSFKDGRVIIDGVRPKDHLEMVARLWGHYGHGYIRVTTRCMDRGESYAEMPELADNMSRCPSCGMTFGSAMDELFVTDDEVTS